MTHQNRDASSDECTSALFVIVLIAVSFFAYKAISGWLHHEQSAAMVTSPPAYSVTGLQELRAGQVVDFTQGKNRAGLLAGWSVSEPQGVWSLGTEAPLGFMLPAEGAPKGLNIKAGVFLEPEKLPKQHVEIWSGDTKLAAHDLTAVEAEFVVPLDNASMNKDRALILTFHLPDSATPREVLGTPDDRRIAIQLKSVGGLP
jgi:hypothetical protein